MTRGYSEVLTRALTYQPSLDAPPANGLTDATELALDQVLQRENHA